MKAFSYLRVGLILCLSLPFITDLRSVVNLFYIDLTSGWLITFVTFGVIILLCHLLAVMGMLLEKRRGYICAYLTIPVSTLFLV